MGGENWEKLKKNSQHCVIFCKRTSIKKWDALGKGQKLVVNGGRKFRPPCPTHTASVRLVINVPNQFLRFLICLG